MECRDGMVEFGRGLWYTTHMDEDVSSEVQMDMLET